MGFGRSKKDEAAGDLDDKKRSLFGGRSKSSKTSSPAPSSANPYAAPQTGGNANPYAKGGANPYASQGSNPYAKQGGNDPYAPKSQTSLSQPPNSSFGSLTLNGSEVGGAPPSYRGPGSSVQREKSPVPPGGYGGGAPRPQGYGQSSYGQAGGYGSDPYGNGGSLSRYGAGGYGGLGRSNSQDTVSTDVGRNALFGDAAQRAAKPPPAAGQPEPGQDSSYGNAYGTGGYDSTEMPGGYGSLPPRELTEEEQEEGDVQAAKQEIKFIKQQDVASTRNARRIAEQAEQTGRETLERLGRQGEMIHNTEKNLDMTTHQNRIAQEKAGELKTLNRSMFAVHVANPFTAKKREESNNAIALEKHQRERYQREATRAEAYSSQTRKEQQQRDLNGNLVRQAPTQRTLADRAKHQFEADSDDDEMENEIDDNLYVLPRLPLMMMMMMCEMLTFGLVRLLAVVHACLTSWAKRWAMSWRARTSILVALRRRLTLWMIRLP